MIREQAKLILVGQILGKSPQNIFLVTVVVLYNQINDLRTVRFFWKTYGPIRVWSLSTGRRLKFWNLDRNEMVTLI